MLSKLRFSAYMTTMFLTCKRNASVLGTRSLVFEFELHAHANTISGNFIKAFIWGLILGTLSSVWWINLFPNLFGPNTNAGIFFTNVPAAAGEWWKWLIAVYLWHLVWAFNLGAFYQPKDIPVTQEA